MDAVKALLVIAVVTVTTVLLTLLIADQISNAIFKVTFAYVAGAVSSLAGYQLVQRIGPQPED